MPLFDKFVNETTVKGVITAVDPLHIGASGKNSLDPIEIDDAVLKDSKGLPVIPGSSLKGMLRSRFEAVLRSIDEKKVCDFSDKNDPNCLTEDEAKNIHDSKEMSDREKAELVYEKNCDVCRLFGGREIAGRIYFKDCYCKSDNVIYEYRDGVRIDRQSGAAAGKAKFDYEIVPKGTEFDFYLIACNLDETQMKYLNFILRELEGGELSIGGKTTRGFGRIQLKIDERITKTADDYKKELGIQEAICV